MDEQTQDQVEPFVELLIEIAALQRLYSDWRDAEVCQDALEPQMAILQRLLEKKLVIRGRKLSQLREDYPEISQFGWAHQEILDA